VTTRFAVIRGNERFNHSELGMYAELRGEWFEPELICPRRCFVTEAEAGMPITRLSIPFFAGRFSTTLPGGYLLGRISPYRHHNHVLVGFHRAVRSADVLCPADLGHPTSFQSVQERRFGKKVLVQCWENIPFNWPHELPVREHYEAVLDGADHFLALTEDARRALRSMGVRDERISRVNIGLRLDYWKPRDRAEKTSGPLELLFVGRLTWAKGVQTVLEAIDLLAVPLRLTVVGYGEEEGRLRWLIEQRARRGSTVLAKSVRFLGPRWGAELVALRQEADVQVAPSIPTSGWREQMNQSLLEGFACGLPAIASESGAITESLSDHENGLLVPPDAPAKLAAAIQYLNDHPEERRRMGQRARERMEQDYNLPLQTKRLASVLRTKGFTA
jgi:glycosyltransferase involved in cell wall biosynthesis